MTVTVVTSITCSSCFISKEQASLSQNTRRQHGATSDIGQTSLPLISLALGTPVHIGQTSLPLMSLSEYQETD